MSADRDRTVVPADELHARREAREARAHAAAESYRTPLDVIAEADAVASRLVAWSQDEQLVDADWVHESGQRLWLLLEVLRACEVSRSAQ